MLSIRIMSLLAAVSVALMQYAQAHPCELYDPFPFRCPYGRVGYNSLAGYSFGDVTFVDQYPDPATLTDIEAYMVNGCMQDETQAALDSWWRIVMRYVEPYYEQYGVIPTQLTPEVMGDTNPDDFEKVVSPITGDYPRLDCTAFSPGNMYVKVLTEAEMQQIAAVSKTAYAFWYEGQAQYPPDFKTHSVRLNGPVYYVRIYGYNDVIFNTLTYSFVTED